MDPLLSVEEALERVLERVPEGRIEDVPLGRARGRILTEAVASDGHYPPFPRSRVDGYAVRAQDAGLAREGLTVVAEIPAGAAPGARIVAGEAARIFTGAALPDGADTVVMQEHCDRDGDRVSVRRETPIGTGNNFVPTGAECRAGAQVAAAGDRLTPGRIGALASVGAATVRVYARPTARVIATGDELVPIDQQPGPGSIRNSNAHALSVALDVHGADVLGHAIAGDAPDALEAAVGEALEADLVLLSGGVSVGDYDRVPQVLAEHGVEKVLHGVRMQPGKPLWFGVRGRTLVFGLPGNPVSSLVGLHLFVRPVVRRLLGHEHDGADTVTARLGGALPEGAWRRKYVPARLARFEEGTWVATPVPYRGSGDVFGFADANALLVVPEDAPPREPGDLVEVLPLEFSRS